MGINCQFMQILHEFIITKYLHITLSITNIDLYVAFFQNDIMQNSS